MPFIAHTPEALLPRSDSKNPATTCKGITSSGRPCRRSLAASPQSSPGRRPSSGNGVLAVLHDGDGHLGNDAAAFYCWQHKDQANQLTSGADGNTEVVPLQRRSSIDTLIARLGVLDIDRPEKNSRKKGHKTHQQNQGIKKRDTLPNGWHEVPGPLLTVPEEILPRRKTNQTPRPVMERPVRRTHKHINIFCCSRALDQETMPPSRPRVNYASGPVSAPRPPTSQIQASSHVLAPISPQPSPGHLTNPTTPIRRRPVSSNLEPQRQTATSLHRQSAPTSTPPRPSLPSTPNSSASQTQALLSYIPPTLPPQTTSLLLTELAKPISPADEAGYIYMFWLTPETQSSHPADDESSSLLAPPSSSSPATARNRRTSDVLQRYGSVSASHRPTKTATSTSTNSKKTILLKIGRAANVQRRLQQWTKQCAHNVSLIRYYPYVGASSSSASSSDLLVSVPPTPTPRKVPHVHRVERLIHIELAEKRARGQGVCGSCGKEHREWFEIEARAGALGGVDEVVRRWVEWAEGLDRRG